jgi:hypothetical protein
MNQPLRDSNFGLLKSCFGRLFLDLLHSTMGYILKKLLPDFTDYRKKGSLSSMEIGNDYKISGAGKKFVSLLSPR